ncbi:MAG: hypothetical protein ABH804_00255 [archaeon]
MKKISPFLIKAIGIYTLFFLVLTIRYFFFSATEFSVHEKAVVKMGFLLIFIWICFCGSLMYLFRDKIKKFIQKIPLGWKIKFILFAIILLLIEEAIAVSMSNLAPFFGSEIGKAYITASANYFHTIFFHSAIVIIPMFFIWAFFLSRYDFKPTQVFLLFGLSGSIGEATMAPVNFIMGFWFFIYGLMIYLPAYSLPDAKKRGAEKPKLRHYILSVIAPLIFAMLFGFLARILQNFFRIELFVN